MKNLQERTHIIKELELSSAPYSFIYQDNLCIYEPRPALLDLFMLDLSKKISNLNKNLGIDSMTWKGIEQQEEYRAGIEGIVYQDHFVTLKEALRSNENKNVLCFLNLCICFVIFFVPYFLRYEKHLVSF